MWPGYAFTDRSVPQRKQNIAKAKALLNAAGATNLNLTLTCYRSFEMPDYAQRVAQALKKVGINCQVKVYTSAQYFDGVSFGATGKLAPWLGTDFGIVDYGHRPVPLTYLNAALRVARRLERGPLSQQEVRQDDRQLPVRDRASQTQKKYATADGAAAAQGHAGDLRLLLQLHRRRRARRFTGYVPDGIAVVNLRGVTIG